MKNRLFSILCFAICVHTQAQTIDTASLSSYPPSVIIKVYDVATKVALTSAEQILLADIYKSQEMELSAAILNGNGVTYVDSMKRRNIGYFNSLLTMPRADEYYIKNGGGRAATTARLTADMIQYKYNTDSIMRRYFNDIYGWREIQIERIWQRHTDTTIRNNNLSQIIYVYDSLLSVYHHAAAGGSYLASTFHYLDSVQTLDTSKKGTVARHYYADCMKYPYRSFADVFDSAFNHVFNTPADTLYYACLYGKEIYTHVLTASQLAIAGMVKRDKISSYAVQQISPYIANRERSLALINKLYPDYTPTKDSMVDMIIALYQPPIDSILAKDGNYNNGSQIDIAIKLSLELGLTGDQKDQLQISLDQLNAMKLEYKNENPAGEYDSKVFESERLTNILSTDQYTDVLTSKFYGSATNMAVLDWKELVKNGLEVNFDSSNTHLTLTNYHLATLIAFYRYALSQEEQYLAVRRIQEVMPDQMRLLLERWEYRTPYADTPDLFYQW